jgi:hypothetical protein
MNGMIVEDHPKIETQRSEIPQAIRIARQHGDREIASETKQQITHRERGKQK